MLEDGGPRIRTMRIHPRRHRNRSGATARRVIRLHGGRRLRLLRRHLRVVPRGARRRRLLRRHLQVVLHGVTLLRHLLLLHSRQGHHPVGEQRILPALRRRILAVRRHRRHRRRLRRLRRLRRHGARRHRGPAARIAPVPPVEPELARHPSLPWLPHRPPRRHPRLPPSR